MAVLPERIIHRPSDVAVFLEPRTQNNLAPADEIFLRAADDEAKTFQKRRGETGLLEAVIVKVIDFMVSVLWPLTRHERT